MMLLLLTKCPGSCAGLGSLEMAFTATAVARTRHVTAGVIRRCKDGDDCLSL